MARPPIFSPPPPVQGFVVYDVSTGLIQRVGYCSPGAEQEQAMLPGEAVLLSRNPLDTPQYTHKVDVGQDPRVIVPLSPMPLAVDQTAIVVGGVDTATISGVPSGAVLSVNGVLFGPVDDGVVTFTETELGYYVLQFELPGWLLTEVGIDVLTTKTIAVGTAAVGVVAEDSLLMEVA
jgi:hypothetical protein